MSSVQQVCVAPNVSSETGAEIPIGTIITYPLATAPTGYLNCDGSAISRATYSGLFNLIGTTYGVGNAGAINVFSWSIVSNILTLVFGVPQTLIAVGTSFTFDTGSAIYSQLIATSVSTFLVQADIGAGNTSSTGGTVQLTTPTTFNLPNTVGVTIRGSGTSWNVATTGGADTYALTPANIASHKHDITIVQNGTGAASGGISTSAPPNSGTSYTTGIIYDNSNSQVTAAGASGSAFSVINKYLVLHYCIKY